MEIIERPEKFKGMDKDEVMQIEKGYIRQRKLDYLLKKFNSQHCCPKKLMDD